MATPAELEEKLNAIGVLLGLGPNHFALGNHTPQSTEVTVSVADHPNDYTVNVDMAVANVATFRKMIFAALRDAAP